jgi:hypothetical protein
MTERLPLVQIGLSSSRMVASGLSWSFSALKRRASAVAKLKLPFAPLESASNSLRACAISSSPRQGAALALLPVPLFAFHWCMGRAGSRQRTFDRFWESFCRGLRCGRPRRRRGGSLTGSGAGAVAVAVAGGSMPSQRKNSDLS